MNKEITMPEEETEVPNLPATVEPNAVVLMAMQKGYTPELIEKMMALQERFEATEARKAFYRAMAKFKANPPKLLRDIQVKYEVGNKVTEWSHADLATAADAINKSLGENGLNATWRTLPLEGNKTRVTCIIAHELGHSEETYLESSPDTTGSKNAIQAIGSAIFYLERYTLFALTGLAPARMDDDGKNAGGTIGLLEQWGIKCDEAGTNAKSIDEIAEWWKLNSPAIKKELSKANAAKIFERVVAHKNRLKEPEREPGNDDK